MQSDMERRPRFSIGLEYTHRFKNRVKQCRIIDIYETRNAAGELVKFRYVVEYPGPGGQMIRDYDVLDTTIAIALANTH